MLISVGERISNSLCAMAVHDLGHEAISLTGSQAGHRHRHRPRQGEDRRGARDAHQRRARRREDRARRRLPGRLGRLARRDDARPRRLEPHRRRARGRARRRARARCTPTSRASSPPTRASSRTRASLRRRHVRGDARALGERREGAPATLGRVRAQPRRAAARALDVLRRRGDVDRRRGGSRAREGDHQRRRAHRLRAALPRPRDRRGAAVRAASRRRTSTSTRSSRSSRDEIVFSAPVEDRAACEELLGALDVEWSMRDDLGKVSLVGAGMKSHPGIAAKTFATLDGHRRRAGGHLHLADQDRLPRPHRGRAEGRRRAARRVRAGDRRCARRADRRRRRDRRRRHGDARGSCASAATRTSARSPRRAPPAAGARRPRLTVEEATPEALAAGGLDLVLFSVRHERVARARPARGRGRRARRRQVERLPARGGLSRSSCPR